MELVGVSRYLPVFWVFGLLCFVVDVVVGGGRKGGLLVMAAMPGVLLSRPVYPPSPVLRYVVKDRKKEEIRKQNHSHGGCFVVI